MQEIRGLVQDGAILPTRQIPTHLYHDYYLIDIARPQGSLLSSHFISQLLAPSFHRVLRTSVSNSNARLVSTRPALGKGLSVGRKKIARGEKV